MGIIRNPNEGEPTPRTLPSGWWDGIPREIRDKFDRKVLRQGYLLHSDGKAAIIGFFRNALQVEVEEKGVHLVHYSREDESGWPTLHSRIACSCGRGVSLDSCPHIAAALFASLELKGYESSPWSHLALGLCRTHAAKGPVSTILQPAHIALQLADGSPILTLDAGPEFRGKWNAAPPLPEGWETASIGGVFGSYARHELTVSDRHAFRVMAKTPSQNADFGPVGEICRRAFLMAPKVNARLDWDDTRDGFRLELSDAANGIKAVAYLGSEQAFSFRNRLPEITLGHGFGPSGETWVKGMEIRVSADGVLRLRPFALSPEGNRIFPNPDSAPLYFGAMPQLPGIGFRSLSDPPGSLFKRYSGWKTYAVPSRDILDFLSKYGEEFGSGSLTKDPAARTRAEYDLDPLLQGGFHPVPIDVLEVRVEEREGKRLRLGLAYQCGGFRLELADLKGMRDEGRPCLLTPSGWVDTGGPDWSWTHRLKPEAWQASASDGVTLWIDIPLLIRIAALQAPGRIALAGIAVPELQALLSVSSQADPDPISSEAMPVQGLRPYQAEGLRWLAHLVANGVSGILADDMGLGKTHQVMALAAWLHQRIGPQVRILVVCPTSVLYHWKEKFAAYHPQLEAALYYGPGRLENALENKVVITSFGIARNDMERLRTGTFDLAVIDEIQNAKNRESETHRCFLDFPARSIIGLSGTPLENGPSDVKNLFDLLLPGYFPGESQFRQEILDPLEKRQGAKEAIARFQRLCRPFILRRTKAQVLTDLPEKVEETLLGDMAADQAALYRECLEKRGGALLQELLQNRTASYLHVFQLLSHLKQVCNHPMSLPGAERGDKDYGSGKWELFEYILAQALEAGFKVVVFSQYLAMLNLIEAHLTRSGIGFATLTGSTRDRPGVLKRFRDDPACRVFCCSLKAGGVGIDLTAASTVIHYDRWWNAARENQATDRVHRLGQPRNVQVFKLVTRDTLEERIDAIIRRKAEYMDSLLPDDGEESLKLFSPEELIELLRP